MILTGNTLCLPSSATVHSLFSAAREGGIIPDISLDSTIADFLSLDSGTALSQHYTALQHHLSAQQRTAFNQDLTSAFGGSTKVSQGGVGVVALALFLLFEVLAPPLQSQEGHNTTTDPTQRILGISNTSRIGSIIGEYLQQIPGIADDPNKMAEVTELYDQLLKYELIDHFERMTNKKRMSSLAMKQWLGGAAVHLHMRLHQIRLGSVPRGSAEALRLSYMTGFTSLVKGYTAYLRRNIQETPASPGPRNRSGPQERAPSPGPRSGLLVVEPLRNMSHGVQHHPCEAKALGEALVGRIIAAQDLQHSRDFFHQAERDFNRLVRQRGDFELH